ncbi:MAG: hypothetical protein KGH98_02345 [Candidatus Micrarchaeota archaeon]|nr:hypothetical protein [Candidatus Micrarchaeota archaeon]
MAKKRGHRRDPLGILLAALLVILPIAIFYTIITYAGPSWDIIARYLNGRTFDSFLTHGISAQAAFLGEFTNNALYYFEPYREPLSTPIFAILTPLFHNPILPYIIVVYALYLLSARVLFKELKIDWLIGLAGITNTFLVFFLFVPNGGEGLAAIFIFLGLAFLLRKSPLSGLFFGLAGIAKYPALILLPLVLFLKDKKLIALAILLELLPVLAWGLIDYAVYGVPFYSYSQSISDSNTAAMPTGVYASSVVGVIAFPLAFTAAAALFFAAKRCRFRLRLDYAQKVLIAFVALSGLGYAAILPHNDPVTQMRYGFLFSLALLVAAVVLLCRATKDMWWPRYAVAAAMSVALLASLFYTYSTSNTVPVAYYNPDFNASIYSHAYSELAGLGFAGCRFVSNAWVPMVYAGYDAYSPFIAYGNGALTPIAERLLNSSGNGVNYTDYLKEELSYPIVVFAHIGVPESEILNLNSSRLAYSDANMSIYLPTDAGCYRD